MCWLSSTIYQRAKHRTEGLCTNVRAWHAYVSPRWRNATGSIILNVYYPVSISCFYLENVTVCNVCSSINLSSVPPVTIVIVTACNACGALY